MDDGFVRLFDLANYSLLLIFLVSTVIILFASEAGRWLGARARAGGDIRDEALEAAVVGLLALMIAFTFAMSLSRFDDRREAVLHEANAIGTTALRARLLPAPYDRESIRLLQDYTQVRLQITQRVPSAQEFEAAVLQSNAIQEALWQRAMAVARQVPGMVPTGVYIETLNRMIDDQETRLTALHNRVPTIVILALYGIAMIASAFSGFGEGFESGRSRLRVYTLGILVSAVILLIQDLDRPGPGFISVSQQPMINTARSIAAFADQPRGQTHK